MDLPCPVGTAQLACNGFFELIPTNPMVRSGKSFPIPTQLTVPHDLFSDASFASTVASVESVASQQESAWWKTSTRRGWVIWKSYWKLSLLCEQGLNFGRPNFIIFISFSFFPRSGSADVNKATVPASFSQPIFAPVDFSTISSEQVKRVFHRFCFCLSAFFLFSCISFCLAFFFLFVFPVLTGFSLIFNFRTVIFRCDYASL